MVPEYIQEKVQVGLSTLVVYEDQVGGHLELLVFRVHPIPQPKGLNVVSAPQVITQRCD